MSENGLRDRNFGAEGMVVIATWENRTGHFLKNRILFPAVYLS